ncbi:hypothetical protein PMG11_11382 [Penicillium brasilianum]|uniref:Uncharacterized protein n=1 Tax=Penicillium brasilianum TaxID=104259 RepID=A0A0F7U5Y5_PENBI|nr:hypothetical protein PMG11_11382 [Penicillium brasilianum]
MMPPIVETCADNPLPEIDEEVVDALRLLDSFNHGPCRNMQPEEKKLLYISVFEGYWREAFEELDLDEAFEVWKRFKENRLYYDLGIPMTEIYQTINSVRIGEHKRRKLKAILVLGHAITLKYGEKDCC